MPMPKKKPGYDADREMREMLNAVCGYFGAPADDRSEEDPEHVSLHEVADRFNITVMKARKLLITGNMYSTETSRTVQELYARGMTLAEITERTGLRRSSVNSYIPYSHIVYKLPDVSIKAERQKQYRVRIRNRARTDEEREESLWRELSYLQGCVFTTDEGTEFTYRITGGIMVIEKTGECITRDEVSEAYRKAVRRKAAEGEPKKDGVLPEKYLVPVFARMALINTAGA